MMAVAQPRRIAALSVAKRIAEEQESVLGQGSVGYSVRFGNCSSDATRILLCTDGMLLRELLSDPLLTRYACVMVDEAHEKSLESDLLLALLKKVLAVRRDLRVIVCSATLNVAEFERFFSLRHSVFAETNNSDAAFFTPAVVHVPARQFPVDILYLRESCADYVAKTVAVIEDIHAREPAGDVLAFLAGKEEIETAMRLLRRRPGHGEYALLPCALHGSLSLENQVFFSFFSVFLSLLILSFLGASV
jgi:HrpA-like RNA helicase